MKNLWVGVRGIVAVGLALTALSVSAKAPLLRWQLVAEYPRDANGFTQGLLWHEGRLFESDGQYGASQVAEKNLETGKTLNATALPAHEFGEGLAAHDGSLWQLTWREGQLHRYDLKLRRLGGLRYGGEGWGITSDGQALIVSNGSAALRWLDPAGPSVLRSISVFDGNQPITRLNELEWVDGLLYANVWLTDRVAQINPENGQVTGWLDFAKLKARAGISREQEAEGAVLNGIAYRPETRTLLVTGKRWPKIFEVRLLSAPQ